MTNSCYACPADADDWGAQMFFIVVFLVVFLCTVVGVLHTAIASWRRSMRG